HKFRKPKSYCSNSPSLNASSTGQHQIHTHFSLSISPTLYIMLSASRVLAPLIGAAILLRPVLGHCKIVNVASTLSAAGPRSHGFGVDFTGKYPWHINEPGDAGADAVFFSPRVEYVANPQYPCGQLVTMPKGLDIKSHLAQAEAKGVATTAADGSFEALIFQVNRDGGGSCTCEFDPTGPLRHGTAANESKGCGKATARIILRNFNAQLDGLPGGVFPGQVFDANPLRPRPLQLKVSNGGSSSVSNGIDSAAAKVFEAMKSKGALTPLSNAKRSTKQHRSSNIEERADQKSTQVDAVALKVISMMKEKKMGLVQQKATLVAKSFKNNSIA
ncbi:hypothetical protein PSTT_15167, partial [Puccinia striiformis]